MFGQYRSLAALRNFRRPNERGDMSLTKSQRLRKYVNFISHETQKEDIASNGSFIALENNKATILAENSEAKICHATDGTHNMRNATVPSDTTTLKHRHRLSP